jgi:1,4-dihydroxy-2-naphthoate octaprenyltransferase
MSAAPGTEALDAPPPAPDPPPAELLAVQHVRRPWPVPRPQPSAEPSGAGDWARALRLHSLPTRLLGATVALLLLLGQPSMHAVVAAVAVAGLVVLHLLGALLQALADPRRDRAGPLRRVEAGRVVLGLAAVGVVLAGVLTAQRGWPALVVAAAGLAVVVLRTRATYDVVGPVATVASGAAVWWAASGDLSWQVLVAALPAGLLVAALRTRASSRVLLAAPCAGVGLAVALHALPWPALLVALSLPAARRAAVSGQPADAPARLALVLLIAGLVVALATGVDLPLTASR